MPEQAPHAAGGLWVGLLRLVHLDDSSPRGLRRRVAAVALLAWLPLLLLAAADGRLVGGTEVPFLRDLEAQVRLLIVIPLLLVAEVEARAFLPKVVQEFPLRGLVPAESMPRYDAAVEAGRRLRNSVWAEAALLVLVYAVFMGIIWRQYGALYASTWYSTRSAAGNELSAAGWWYVTVSLPLVQFLLLRWYLWIVAWARFLWQTSRIRLSLMPTHPDRSGGLGFLENSGQIFLIVAVAHGALAAGPIASQIFFKGAALPQFVDELALVVAWVVLRDLRPGPVLLRAADYGQEGRPVRVRAACPALRARLRRQMARRPSAAARRGARRQRRHPVAGRPGHRVRQCRGPAPGADVRMWPCSAWPPITLLPVAPLLLTMVPFERVADQAVLDCRVGAAACVASRGSDLRSRGRANRPSCPRARPASFLHQVILWTLPKAFITVVLTLGPVLLLSTCL